MLQLIVGNNNEFFNEKTGEFITIKPQKITLEHSLFSISKWEAKWKKPFFSEKEMSPALFKDYIKFMTITPNVDNIVYECLTFEQLKAIKEYMSDPMSATKIRSNDSSKKSGRIITSELVYYWMFAQNIPIECDKWHFNRLMTLIRITSIENNPKKKKMGRRDLYNQNAELNRQRRKMHNTSG